MRNHAVLLFNVCIKFLENHCLNFLRNLQSIWGGGGGGGAKKHALGLEYPFIR